MPKKTFGIDAIMPSCKNFLCVYVCRKMFVVRQTNVVFDVWHEVSFSEYVHVLIVYIYWKQTPQTMSFDSVLCQFFLFPFFGKANGIEMFWKLHKNRLLKLKIVKLEREKKHFEK